MPNNTPWWFTLTSVALTGALTLVTSWLVARHTSRKTDERLNLEIEHKSDLERRKLLYDARQELYLEIFRSLHAIHDMVAVVELSEDQENAITALIQTSRKIPELSVSATLIASVEVADVLEEISSNILTFLKMVNHVFHSRNEVRADEMWHEAIDVDKHGKLLHLMRRDLGSEGKDFNAKKSSYRRG
ncbi:hypothetical protein [Amycolatopsis sp. NPDC051061]|uniref:hypothetical protein n=1 Tax=Amycolatopsis sp. NPDC051061 TaxID=3155042 RepID=UPI0034159649